MSQIPIIDLAALKGRDRHQMSASIKGIDKACRSIGCFYIVNHDVPTELQQCVFNQQKALFDLPETEKQKLHIKTSPCMRGYFGHGEDKSDGINDDIKEGFDLALDLPATDPIVQSGMPFYGPNVWPVCLPRFKPVLSTFYRHMLMLGMDLLDAFSISLGVARDCFTDCFQNPIAQIRLLRYPPPVLAKQMRIGAGEHTDFGWLTMIMQDETGGLEVLNNGGSWIPAPALPNSFLINTGDLMQRWTNDEYPATIHRVINRTKYPRYSTAFFMDPDYHTTVSCLPNCTSPNEKPHYEPIMVGEYMKTRFMETTTFRDNETQSSCV